MHELERGSEQLRNQLRPPLPDEGNVTVWGAERNKSAVVGTVTGILQARSPNGM